MSSLKEQAPAGGFTQDQLLQIIAAIKAPPEPTEAEKAQTEQDLQMRKDRAQMELQAIERRRTERLLCSHERTDGTFNVIYIYPGTPDMFRFIYCQSCSGIIRPENERPTDPGKLQDCQEHIFDTQLFNRLFRYAVRPKTDF